MVHGGWRGSGKWEVRLCGWWSACVSDLVSMCRVYLRVCVSVRRQGVSCVYFVTSLPLYYRWPTGRAYPHNNNNKNNRRRQAAAAPFAPTSFILFCRFNHMRAERVEMESRRVVERRAERRQSRHPACHDTPTSTSIQWALGPRPALGLIKRLKWPKAEAETEPRSSWELSPAVAVLHTSRLLVQW